jgi:Mannosyl-glycoprotein endo-beta-N-acetylglucosaminidase
MSRTQQTTIAIIALVLIGLMVPSTPRGVLTNAPGLAPSFSNISAHLGAKLGGQPALAAAAVEVQAPAAPAGELAVQGRPTISVEHIERVLAEWNSPAAGQGQAIYDLGVKYGINPAIFLAFFVQESGAGSSPAWAGRKPDGTFTHNAGNIICTPGWACYGRFRDYGSWSEGIEDWYKLISDLYIGGWQLNTVERIIPKYAPAADNNDEGAYITSVRTLVQQWQGQ